MTLGILAFGIMALGKLSCNHLNKHWYSELALEDSKQSEVAYKKAYLTLVMEL